MRQMEVPVVYGCPIQLWLVETPKPASRIVPGIQDPFHVKP